MSERPAAGRVVVRFAAARAIGAAGATALEDYARELTRARAAFALAADSDDTRLVGIELEEPGVPAEGAVLEDIEAFARDLAGQAGPGLGWS